MANRYFLYEGGNGIENTKKNIEIALLTGNNVYKSIKECFEYICDSYNCLTEGKKRNVVSAEDLSIRYYAYDPRIGYDVYMVESKRYGMINYIEKYGTPQFFSFLIELK